MSVPTRERFFILLIITLTLLLWVPGFAITPGSAEDEPLGFVEAVRETPTRMTSLPQDTATRTLLERFKPQMYVAPGSYRPIGFYEEYLPNSVLEDPRGNVLDPNPGRSDLLRYGDRDGLHLNFRLSVETVLQETEGGTVPVYGRIYADTLTHSGKTVPLLFLKYSVAFPYSGLPAGNSWWKEAGARLAGDSWAWHELDIHGAVHVILHAESRQPLGVLLAQHNHHRTHLRSPDFPWPQDNQISVSYAVRSNEPYLITERLGSRTEPTVGDPSSIKALFERTWLRPLNAGYDRIIAPEDGARHVRTALKLLPHDDPLYTTALDLGDRYRLFGIVDTWFRQGPPGMDYYAPPTLKNLADLAAFWFVDPGDDRFFRTLGPEPDFFDAESLKPVLEHQRERFLRAILRVYKD